MKKEACPNCGADDFVMKDGYKVCGFCNSRYIVTKKSQVTTSLEDDIQTLLLKCEMDPLNAYKYANLILDMDPSNNKAKKYL